MDSIPFSLLLLTIGVTVCRAGECPPDPSTAMQKCAKDMNIDLNSAEGHKFITDKEYTNKMCDGGKEVNEAVACMDTIYKDCTSSGVMDKDLLMKPEAWRMAIKKVCKHKDFLTKNAACIEKDAEDMSSCTERFTKDASAKVNIKHIDITAKGGQAREKYKIICGLSKDLMTCFDDTLLKNCPKKMEKILNEIVYRFLPPVCHPTAKPADTDGTYETVKDNGEGGASSLSAIVSVLVAAIMCLRAFSE